MISDVTPLGIQNTSEKIEKQLPTATRPYAMHATIVYTCTLINVARAVPCMLNVYAQYTMISM